MSVFQWPPSVVQVFFSEHSSLNSRHFSSWLPEYIPVDQERMKVLLPDEADFDWKGYHERLEVSLKKLQEKVEQTPEIYRKQAEKSDFENQENLERHLLLNFLFEEGILPTYSFPRNIVRFWIEDYKGNVRESPERSIDIALSEYAPGRMLVVDKKSYISGGLYEHYSKRIPEFRYKAAERWLNMGEYKKQVTYCPNKECGWFGTDKIHSSCPLCNEKLHSSTMVKPWGFSPRDGIHVPEIRDTQEYSAASSPSYSSMPQDLSLMKQISVTNLLRIESRGNQKLVMLNRGPGHKGFDLCKKCGAIEPAENSDADKSSRKRPYRVLYAKEDSQSCSHQRETIFLGYEFTTDMMVLEFRLEGDQINITPNEYAVWLKPALATFAESLALASSTVLDVEFSDLKCGFRIRHQGDVAFADVYLYDSLSSGAGYSSRVALVIDNVLQALETRLESCDCDTSCPKCVRHFWNANLHAALDRHAALQLLRWVRDGWSEDMLPVQKQSHLLEPIKKKCERSEDDIRIVQGEGGCHIISGGASRPIIVYPAMLPRSKVRIGSDNSIMVPDRLLKIAVQAAWDVVKKQLE